MRNQYRWVGLCAVVMLSSVAGAVTLPGGTYDLHNHPDGTAQPPRYGLRLDELYNATSNHDIFTFDFDAIGSAVTLVYNGSSIVISGQAMGGRDIGGGYAADAFNGLYSFNFVYTIGLGMAPGDDDLMVFGPPDMLNSGSITTPLGDTIQLVDKSNGSYNFRFGDEDNDLGHRGFAGISGWGWLTHGPTGSPHVADSDWIFTATYRIPAPGTAALLGLGGLVAIRRRR